MDAPLIDGPRLEPQGDLPAKHLVVFLHGYGADGQDLIGIAGQWAPYLPDTAFVSPHAPEPCDMNPAGRQWFPLSMRDPSEYWRGVVSAGPILDAFLDAELARWGLSDSDLLLVGFSQGTMMSLHTGLRRTSTLAGIVGYSGLLAGAEHLAAEKSGNPPVVLAHGTADPVVPFEAMAHAANALKAAGIPVQTHAAQGIGHGIDGDGLMLGLQHARAVFGITD